MYETSQVPLFYYQRSNSMKLDDAEKMIYSLMRHHGLVVQDPETVGDRNTDGSLYRSGWIFEWLQSRKRFNLAGQCSHSRKVISLQPYFVLSNYPVIVKRTILHEIAHALTPGERHSKVWKEKAIALGCSGNRTYGKEVKRRIKHKLLK